MLKVLFSNINQQIEGKNLVSVEQKNCSKAKDVPNNRMPCVRQRLVDMYNVQKSV